MQDNTINIDASGAMDRDPGHRAAIDEIIRSADGLTWLHKLTTAQHALISHQRVSKGVEMDEDCDAVILETIDVLTDEILAASCASIADFTVKYAALVDGLALLGADPDRSERAGNCLRAELEALLAADFPSPTADINA